MNEQPNDKNTTVTVPRWALEYIMSNASFLDAGPSGMGWSSDEMEKAVAAISSVLDA